MSKFNVLSDCTVEEFLSGFYVSKQNINTILNSPYKINDSISDLKTLKKGDIIEFDFSKFEKVEFEYYKYKLDIVYEDEFILVVNKPIKMLIHPDGYRSDTLSNAVSFYYNINNLNISTRALHRLDYDTSGLVVFSKDILSHSFINNQLENRKFEREYTAILDGILIEDSGIINKPIGRNRHDSKKYMVSKSGKEAITHFWVIKRSKKNTLVKIHLETGRTHQIRVHFSYLNHPITGDDLYGKKNVRMFLHASLLSFIHPNTRKVITIKANPNDGDGKWIL